MAYLMLLITFLIGLGLGGVLMLAGFTVLILREVRRSPLDPADFSPIGAAEVAAKASPSLALDVQPGGPEGATEAAKASEASEAPKMRQKPPCALCNALRAALGLRTRDLTGK